MKYRYLLLCMLLSSVGPAYAQERNQRLSSHMLLRPAPSESTITFDKSSESKSWHHWPETLSHERDTDSSFESELKFAELLKQREVLGDNEERSIAQGLLYRSINREARKAIENTPLGNTVESLEDAVASAKQLLSIQIASNGKGTVVAPWSPTRSFSKAKGAEGTSSDLKLSVEPNYKGEISINANLWSTLKCQYNLKKQFLSFEWGYRF